MHRDSQPDPLQQFHDERPNCPGSSVVTEEPAQEPADEGDEDLTATPEARAQIAAAARVERSQLLWPVLAG